MNSRKKLVLKPLILSAAILCFILIFFSTACFHNVKPNCANKLEAKDKILVDDFNILLLKKKDGLLNDTEFLKALYKMRKRERLLFEAARNCKFKNQKQRNYWYRNRLKFPSSIEQQIKRLEADKL